MSDKAILLTVTLLTIAGVGVAIAAAARPKREDDIFPNRSGDQSKPDWQPGHSATWDELKQTTVEDLYGDPCKRKCDLKYPFNREARQACKAGC